MDYEYYYNNARNRYYGACSEISGCENRIGDLKNRRQQKINLINQLKTDIKKTQEALDGMRQIVKSDEGLNQKIRNVIDKTNQASMNYTGMASASDVSIKNLNDVYGTETASTIRILNGIFENLKAREKTLESSLTDLQGQLARAESDKQDIENRIRSEESDLQYWKQKKSSASYDMEYYRRKMNEAV